MSSLRKRIKQIQEKQEPNIYGEYFSIGLTLCLDSSCKEYFLFLILLYQKTSLGEKKSTHNQFRSIKKILVQNGSWLAAFHKISSKFQIKQTIQKINLENKKVKDNLPVILIEEYWPPVHSQADGAEWKINYPFCPDMAGLHLIKLWPIHRKTNFLLQDTDVRVLSLFPLLPLVSSPSFSSHHRVILSVLQLVPSGKNKTKQNKGVNYQFSLQIFTLSTIPTHHVLNPLSNNICITPTITIFNCTNGFQK